MTPFTFGEIYGIRHARTAGWRVAWICSAFPKHTRDEIVEAIDATIRHQDNHAAVKHVNYVLNCQAQHVQIINGKEAWAVAKDRGRVSYSPDF